MGRTLIFTRTKHGADKLTKILRRAKVKAEAIHGNKSQNARTKAMDAFRAGKIPVLVATDIASRGIDVDDVTHVINYELPFKKENYIHRIGRAGRFGRKGIAINFVLPNDAKFIREIQDHYNTQIEEMPQDLEDLNMQ